MDLLNVPKRYIPKILSTRDTKKQKQYLRKSRKLYKKGIYYERPKVKSFKSKPSPHINNAQKIYKIDKIAPSAELAKKTQCSQEALEKIVNKGRGAYFSSGSRPNQTAESWGIARLASSISGGNASIVDYHILSDGCKPTSKALKMANRTCKKQNKCQKYFMKGGYSNVEDMMHFYHANIGHYREYIITNDPIHLDIIADNLEIAFGRMDADLMNTVNGLSLDNKFKIKPVPSDEIVTRELINFVKKDIEDIERFLQPVKPSRKITIFPSAQSLSNAHYDDSDKIDQLITRIASMKVTDKKRKLTPHNILGKNKVIKKNPENELELEKLKRIKNTLERKDFNDPEIQELKEAFYFLIFVYKIWFSLKIHHMYPEEFENSYRESPIIPFPTVFDR